MNRRHRVYIAGPYSANNVISTLDNMRAGMRMASELLQTGMIAPFCPFVDHHFQLQLREGESLSVEDYYQYSMAWLEVSDAVLFLPGWRESKGCITERERAFEIGIPSFHSKEELLKWFSMIERMKRY